MCVYIYIYAYTRTYHVLGSYRMNMNEPRKCGCLRQNHRPKNHQLICFNPILFQVQMMFEECINCGLPSIKLT